MATTLRANPAYRPPPAKTVAAAPLTDTQLGALATAGSTQASTPVLPASGSPALAPAPTPAPTVAPVAASPAASPTAAAATTLTDPTRTALSGAVAATPTTAEEFLADFRSKQAPVKPEIQAAADLQRQAMELGLAKDPGAVAAKAAYNQAYLALPREDRLALLKLVQAPSSANKLAGVRSIGAIGAKSGNSTLSDEQLARLAVGQQASAAQPQNDAEARALNTFLLQQGALTSDATQQFVQASTANLNPELAAQREAQQAATAASTAAEIARRLEENVAGTNIGGGQFIGGVAGTPVLGGQPAPAPDVITAEPTVSELALQQGVDVDQRALASLGSIQARQQATAARFPVLAQTGSTGLTRNASNAAAVQRRQEALNALGNQPTGRTPREISLDPNLTSSQKAAEISLNSAPPSANKAAGIRNSTVIENRASTPERDADIIAFARSLAPPGTRLPTTLEEARSVIAAAQAR